MREQGRLTENTKTVNKDDLLAMVRYGAEMVFSSEVGPASLALLHLLALLWCSQGRQWCFCGSCTAKLGVVYG